MRNGSSAPSQEPIKNFLVVVKTDKGRTLDLGRRFQLPPDGLTFGNDEDADISVGLGLSQSYQVEVSKKGISWYVAELTDSGTLLVNMVSVKRAQIFDGDVIQLDEFAFEFSSSRSIKYEFFKENEKARQLDIVTQAYNRGYLYSVLQWEISRRKQSQPSTSRRKKGAVNGLVSMCVIMLDVDHFGEFNKKYDHLIGDQVLRGVVERMKARVRHTDIVARWGGEEFAAFLPDTDKEEAINIAEQILQQIGNHPFIIDTKSLSVTVSLGVAHYEPGMDVDGFMRAADQKMLKAKETGRNKVVS